MMYQNAPVLFKESMINYTTQFQLSRCIIIIVIIVVVNQKLKSVVKSQPQRKQQFKKKKREREREKKSGILRWNYYNYMEVGSMGVWSENEKWESVILHS